MSGFQRERLACAYFFGSVGLLYGIFTARLPAFKITTGANDGQIGFLLLALGGAAFFGLFTCRLLIGRLGTKLVTAFASLFITIAFTIAALATSYMQLLIFCMIAGLANGLCDVAMNAHAIEIERRYHALSMSSFHACFSLGGVLGSLFGSLFAWLALSPFLNFLIVGGAYLLLWPWALRNTIQTKAPTEKTARERSRLPLLVYFLGFMSMCCYVSEGSVGEWGSVLLHSVKMASQQEAALVFGCFSITMVIGRFLGDRLRSAIKEFHIILFGSLIAATAMTIVLLSSSPALCLGAYALMGVGFAPIVPIFYSMSGRIKGVSAGRASSTVSILAYSGLLFFPPFLGMLGDSIGLDNALWVIVCACLGVTCGSLFLRRHTPAA